MTNLVWQIRSRAEILFEQSWAWFGLAIGTLLAVASFSATQGAVDLSLAELSRAFTDEQFAYHGVVWNVRLPRLVCGALVGANLSVAGTLLQTSVRNPLADPGILGVSAGAGIGALCVILFAPGHPHWIPWAAFIGGLGTVTTLIGLAWNQSRSSGPLRIVLSGVALQAVLFAGIALLSFAFADRAPAFSAFVVGSLNGLGWNQVTLLVAPTAIGLALAAGMMRTLNVLLLDDGAASALGLSVQVSRFACACVAALLTAAAVSVAGLVGFVGLVTPNAVRLLVGPDHHLLLPLSAIGGAALVILADTVARTSLAPLELPVGALLSLIGGPYFLYLLRRKLA